MISAESAVSRTRRDLTVGSFIKYTLILAGLFCIVIGLNGPVVITVIAFIWLVLSFRSAQTSRSAMDSSTLIASGQFDAAEKQIEHALTRFSMFRTSKLLSLHHLALLRHAQRHWRDAAVLSHALLGQRLGSLDNLNKSSRLMLADSLLELGDLPGAYNAINALYDQHLSLGEAMNLLQVQLDYLWRVGAWEQMFNPIATKVQLAELMPSISSARVHALLALSAKRLNKSDWESWLRRRAELLCDIQQLITQRPVLAELWTPPPNP
jgi:hypothetical protein